MENQSYIQEDEIDLRERIDVLIKRKKLIFAIFFVAVIAVAITSSLAPKVYEATSTVQIGSVNGLVISKEEVKAIVFNQNSLQAIIKELNLNIDVEGLNKSIKIKDVPGTNLLTINIVSSGLDTILKINDAIVNPLIAQGKSIYQERIAIANERLNELDSEIKNAEAEVDRTQKLISGLSNFDNISQADASLRIILLQSALPNYESNLTALRNQRNALKLSFVNAKDFRVFDQPIKPRNPIASKMKRNVLAAGILSLIFGVFISLFMEFWQKSKKGEAK